MMQELPPLPDGFVVMQGPQAAGPRTIPGAGPKQPTPPSGYRWDEGGNLNPIPGGPADKPEGGDKPPSGYRWTGNGGLEPIPGGPADKGAMAGQNDEAARLKLMSLIGKLGSVGVDANDNGGWFETGTSGAFSRDHLWKGSAGYDLAENIKTVDANLAFDALQAMREASKTGGALGQVTERELELLKSSVQNLDPNQSHGQFMANIENARQAYLSKLAMVDPETATRMGYDAEKAEQALLALNDAYTKSLGLDPTVTIDRSASTQSQNPPDIDAIMAKYGAQ